MATSPKKAASQPAGKGGKTLPANLIDLVHGEDASGIEFPDAIQALPGTDVGVSFEWDPDKPGEMLVGTVLRSNKMQLGGMAFVISAELDYNKSDTKRVTVLLKRGGRVLEARMTELTVLDGDRVAIMYAGTGEAKEGMNAPRLWRVKKLIALAPAQG